MKKHQMIQRLLYSGFEGVLDFGHEGQSSRWGLRISTMKKQCRLVSTVASGNSVSPNSGISRYNGYVQLTDCLFQ